MSQNVSGFYMCPRCEGQGKVWVTIDTDDRLKFRTMDWDGKDPVRTVYPYRCPLCWGTKSLTWIEVIKKGYNPNDLKQAEGDSNWT